MTEDYVHGYTTAEQQRLVDQAEHWRDELILRGTTLTPGTRLLEVGVGVGAVLGILGEAFPGIELAGVDIEPRQVAAAREHLARLGFEADLRQADALDLPFEDGSFDHVWMMWVLEHVADPVAALREARRVVTPGGEITAIEVDYNSVWAAPQSDELDHLFSAVARAMDEHGRSDTGSRLPGWLEQAGFSSVDPGKIPLSFSGDELARQLPYVVAVMESTVAEPSSALRALEDAPGAALGWTVHKSRGVR